MDTRALEELGLTHAEAQVYVALLTQGPSASGALISHTKMQSSTVYHTLGTLLDKGVISYVLRGKIKFFQAEKPDIFLTFWEDKKNQFSELLPELKQKEKTGFEQRSAKVYEGMKGLRAAYADVLRTMKKGETYYFVQVPKEKLQEERIRLFYRQYHSRRAQLGINVRGLTHPGTEDYIQFVWGGLDHTEIRLTDEMGPLSLVIYANKVMTIDLAEEPIVFVIQSKTVADSYRKFVEKKWKTAKKWKEKPIRS